MFAIANNTAFLILCLTCWPNTPGLAQQDDSAQTTPPQANVVLRVSRELIDELTRDQIQMTLPIQRTMQGINVRGSVTANGVTGIRLVDSPDRATFVIVVPGSARANFNGDVGPATVFASSNVTFTAEKTFTSDGLDFFHDTTRTATHSATCVDRICPKRRGPVGQVVKRVGRCVASKQIGQVNQSVNEVARELLADQFDQAANELVEKLDLVTPIEDTMDLLFDESDPRYVQLATTEGSLMMVIGELGAPLPSLPADMAPVELWVRTRPLEAIFLDLLADWEDAHDLLKTFLPEDEARAIAQDMRLQTVDGWSVIQVGVKGE